MQTPDLRTLITGNPVAIAHAVIGDAWSQLILREAFFGVRRFNDFALALGGSRTVLSGRLTRLTESGVLRMVTPPGRKRAEYRLTDMGHDLFGTALMQGLWEAQFVPIANEEGESLTLVSRSDGTVVTPIVLDAAFGRPFNPHDVVHVASPTLKPRLSPALRRLGTARSSIRRPIVHRSVEIIGDYWSWVVVGCAFVPLRRFEEILYATGMAPNVLSDRLGRLTAAGILRRTLYQDSPPRHEYRLTRAGLAFYPMIMAMHGWSERWLCGIESSPVGLYHRDSGGRILPTVCDARTGQPLRAYDVEWRDLHGQAAPDTTRA